MLTVYDFRYTCPTCGFDADLKSEIYISVWILDSKVNGNAVVLDEPVCPECAANWDLSVLQETALESWLNSED